MLSRVKKIYKNSRFYYQYIIKAKNDFEINPLTSLQMKLNGFTPNQYVLYNLKENNLDDYISELERWRTREINGYYNFVLDDKLLFYEMFHKYIDIPENLFWIKDGRILDLNGKELCENKMTLIIKKTQIIFMKPINGGGGQGVFKITFNKNYYLNDKEISLKGLMKYLKKRENIIATKGIEQHNYSNKIYPNSVNTIRVLTIYNSDSNAVSILGALHRFGTDETQPIDNASSGGLFAQIDIKEGVLTEAKNYNNETHEKHPNTHVMIKGQKIPRWKELKKMCLNIASNFPYIPYMAWDIVVTERGFEVIEINASTGLTLFQMWEGKRNSELGSFFKSQRIMK